MNVNRITPLLFAAEIESCAKFWVDRLGYSKTAEVPEDGHLGFVMLSRDSTELMYMTWTSLEKDMPAAAEPAKRGPSFLYVEVNDIEATMAAMEGVEIVQPMRITFYGAKEFGVQDPAGHFVTFAQMGFAPQS
ncbi:MAG: hypothetical protein KGL59_13290 [Acidobacteriota bacterium]|nr:hypothetical protein [Acidobacteriota bacterium]